MNKIELIRGDITKLAVDVIVNAANSSLMGGGGVDGAIHRAGGPGILEECRHIRDSQSGCKTGEAVVTTAGKLNARFVVHTVGPIWNGGTKNEDQLLMNAYRNSLSKAIEKKCKSIAFPNISTGIYGFPKQRAAQIAVQTITSFLHTDNSLNKIIFCCFDEENFTIYSNLLAKKS
jgi:O-acetyl-ADP-ribose deacetylase (regulator of RNase III)